ncbi:hypothetical protein L596_016931 [Steinernema carpocapsae]|uniref:Uncharacterized protein n=1 Tax=Steinernema carpocapsae TaxID=34508 RepID=A0A4U5MZP2_STECR|nr:hypothetical protein L596_016931 [Steinernema carpocapsae]
MRGATPAYSAYTPPCEWTSRNVASVESLCEDSFNIVRVLATSNGVVKPAATHPATLPHAADSIGKQSLR